MRVKAQRSIPIKADEVRPSGTTPASPQNSPLQDYEEEVARVLGSMGIFGEGREQSGNTKEHNCTPNQSTPADCAGHEKTCHALILWKNRGNQFLLWKNLLKQIHMKKISLMEEIRDRTHV